MLKISLVVLTMLTTFVAASEMEQVLEVGRDNTELSAQSQTKIDATESETDKLVNEFKVVSKQVEGLKLYNAQKRIQIQAQLDLMDQYDEQLVQVVAVGHNVRGGDVDALARERAEHVFQRRGIVARVRLLDEGLEALVELHRQRRRTVRPQRAPVKVHRAVGVARVARHLLGLADLRVRALVRPRLLERQAGELAARRHRFCGPLDEIDS